MDDLKYKSDILVETIVGEVKSQGLFDQFRKECLSDVDTKPAYQNLRQRVESTVVKFLSKQEWKPDTNRNQMREKLRKNIIEMGFLDAGVERIVDQVVNPKISTVFLPKIENVVYNYLGIEKPQPKIEEIPAELNGMELVVETDHLMPTDLEAVSPDSDKSDTKSDIAKEEEVEMKAEEQVTETVEPEKIDEEESPPFEPLEVVKDEPNENSQDSHSSAISGLTSQDSIESVHQRNPEVEELKIGTQVTKADSDESKPECVNSEAENKSPKPDPEEDLKEKVGEIAIKIENNDSGNHDSQLSQVSSVTELSPGSSKSDVKEEDSVKIDMSEEAQMPIKFTENPTENGQTKPVLTTFDINSEEIKFEQAKPIKMDIDDDNKSELRAIESADNSLDQSVSQDSVDMPKSQEIQSPEKILDQSICSRVEVNKIIVKAAVTEDSESLLDSGDSMDLKIVETDSMGSVSEANHNSLDTKSQESTVLEVKKDRSTEKKSSSSSSHHRKSSSSTSRHKSSSHKSSKDKDRHRSRDHRSSSDKKSSSHSKSKKDSDRKHSSSKTTDDHGSHKEKLEKRRSTDRDSNDGSNPGNNQKSSSNGDRNKSKSSSHHHKSNSSSSSSPKDKAKDSGPTDKESVDKKEPERSLKPVIVDQILSGKEISLQMIFNETKTLDKTDPDVATISQMTEGVKKKKPKIASNMKEAIKLSKVRKEIDREEMKTMEKAAVLAKDLLFKKQLVSKTNPVCKISRLDQGMEIEFACNKADKPPEKENEFSDFEEDLLYFPEENSKWKTSVTEQWWEERKKLKDAPGLIDHANAIIQRAKRKAEEDKEIYKTQQAKKSKTVPKNGLTKKRQSKDAIDLDDVYQETVVDLNELPDEVNENNNFQTVNKNFGILFNKLGPLNGGESVEMELVTNNIASTEEKRSRPKPPITQTQRYTSEDLYKPRPVTSRTRRSRVSNEPDSNV